jgi:two-component system NarL family sensor kinase
VVRALRRADLVRTSDPASLRRLDCVVRARVKRVGSVERVKLWTPDGRIIYSDEPRLIGARYALGEDEQDALRSGRIIAELSDLSRPENCFE